MTMTVYRLPLMPSLEPTLTFPGEKSSMETYIAERYPHLAPVSHSERLMTGAAEIALAVVGRRRGAYRSVPSTKRQCQSPFCSADAEFRIGGLYEGHPNGHQTYACHVHAADMQANPHIYSGPAYATAL
jgi:hypothetical protein